MLTGGGRNPLIGCVSREPLALESGLIRNRHMLSSHVYLRAAIFGFLFCAVSTNGLADESRGPGGTSRALHIDCGFYSPGNPPWTPEHDKVVAADGYGYTVRGRSYRGGASGGHCWFFDRGGFTIRCPRGVEGRLYLHFVDLSNNQRRQSVTVCGDYRGTLADFFEPAGKWQSYEIRKQHTANGRSRSSSRKSRAPTP